MIGKKVRDKEMGVNEVVQWAQTPRELTKEIFDKISDDTGLSPEEAMQFWEERTSRQVKRYNYGAATFIHPEVRAKTKKATSGSKSRSRGTRNTGRNQGRNQGRNTPQRKEQKPKTAQEWWENASTKSKEHFIRAWYAEFGGQLEVLRFETHVCRNCGGKGVEISRDSSSNEEIRTICPVCNLAAHERVVICR